MTKEQYAKDIIQKHVIYSMGGSMIPIPIIDLAAVTAIQLDMVKQLANLYHVDYSESSGKAFISSLTGSIFARIGASFLKGIPGIGTILGGISLVALSGAATYAIGEVFLNHFSGGGTFKDFSAESYKQYYEEQYEEGKEKAKAWKEEHDAEKEVKEQASSASDLLMEKLKELGDLKEKGVINKKEFDQMKKQIMAEYADKGKEDPKTT